MFDKKRMKLLLPFAVTHLQLAFFLLKDAGILMIKIPPILSNDEYNSFNSEVDNVFLSASLNILDIFNPANFFQGSSYPSLFVLCPTCFLPYLSLAFRKFRLACK